MATSPDAVTYPPEAIEELARLAEQCRLCLQCGECTSSCPSGRELYRGPRRIVRLLLAGEVGAVLESDDLWRCTECGACTKSCRMDIDVAAVLHGLRQLERRYGRLTRCPERAAAEIAAKRLVARPRIDNARFGMAMAAHGHVPRDLRGAAGAGLKAARQWLPNAGNPPTVARRPAAGDAVVLPFYAGCALPQDRELHALVRGVAAGFGVRLDEAADAGCCGHPSRGAVSALFRSSAPIYTACPACDASLAEAGMQPTPLWDALTVHASRRSDLSVRAGAAAFVPYVGCLADRDAALGGLADAGSQAGADMRLAYPTLHSGCCGALGGMYRGATKASLRLLEFAREAEAPVVTTCMLCRDNLRSAGRQTKIDVPVHYWPEFFRATRVSEERTDD